FPGTAYGVCLDHTECTTHGGSYTNGDCPNDPNNVKCCYNDFCDNGAGECMWVSDCNAAGRSHVSNYCPGPSNFECCLDKL
ncbi:hypothetical protein AOQ84DRAFT_276135, partial [Glonium stellatum]